MNGFQRKQIDKVIEAFELGNLYLNDFEQDFIYSLEEKNDDYLISEKQNSILNNLSSKIL